MTAVVVAFEGPVGVGKTALGRAISKELGIGFVDGDDCSEPGPWLHSILRTSRRIAATCEEELIYHPAVIMAYPLRCTDWLFYRETFRRQGIALLCIGLTANIANIARRGRVLTMDELERASQMLAQGYGERPFSDRVIRTDEGSFEFTSDKLVSEVRSLLANQSS